MNCWLLLPLFCCRNSDRLCDPGCVGLGVFVLFLRTGWAAQMLFRLREAASSCAPVACIQDLAAVHLLCVFFTVLGFLLPYLLLWCSDLVVASYPFLAVKCITNREWARPSCRNAFVAVKCFCACRNSALSLMLSVARAGLVAASCSWATTCSRPTIHLDGTSSISSCNHCGVPSSIVLV